MLRHNLVSPSKMSLRRCGRSGVDELCHKLSEPEIPWRYRQRPEARTFRRPGPTFYLRARIECDIHASHARTNFSALTVLPSSRYCSRRGVSLWVNFTFRKVGRRRRGWSLESLFGEMRGSTSWRLRLKVDCVWVVTCMYMRDEGARCCLFMRSIIMF